MLGLLCKKEKESERQMPWASNFVCLLETHNKMPTSVWKDCLFPLTHNSYVISWSVSRLTSSSPNISEKPSWSKNRNGSQKTYNSGYSLVVTDPTTNPPISSLSTAERTGCPIFLNLWSYAEEGSLYNMIDYNCCISTLKRSSAIRETCRCVQELQGRVWE